MLKKFILLFSFLFVSCVFASPQERILLVADAHYEYSNSDLLPYYIHSLNELNLNYDLCTIDDLNGDGPGYDDKGGCAESITGMKDYDLVIWFTGNDYGYPFYTLTSTDQEELEKFLDNSGKLFITGQDIGKDIGAADFYRDYLHAYFCKNDAEDYSLEGTSNEPIGDSLLINIDGGAGNQEYPSLISYVKEGLLTTTSYPNNNSFYYGLVTDKIYRDGRKCYCGDREIDKEYCIYQEYYCVVADDGTVLHHFATGSIG